MEKDNLTHYEGINMRSGFNSNEYSKNYYLNNES